MTVSPAFSKRRTTSPMRLRATPSGLMMEKVRSSAMDIDLRIERTNADRARLCQTHSAERSEPRSVLGAGPRRNLNGGGSAGNVRVFNYSLFKKPSIAGRLRAALQPPAAEHGRLRGN